MRAPKEGGPMTCKFGMFALICAMSLTSFLVGYF
jgi:hypothetical protein